MTTPVQAEWLYGIDREPDSPDAGRRITALPDRTLFSDRPTSTLRRQRSSEEIADSHSLWQRRGMFATKKPDKAKISKRKDTSPRRKLVLPAGKTVYHPHIDVIKARVAMSPYWVKPVDGYTPEVLGLMDATNLMSESGGQGKHTVKELGQEQIDTRFDNILMHTHQFVKDLPQYPKVKYNELRYPVSPTLLSSVREQQEARQLEAEKEKTKKEKLKKVILRNASADLELVEAFLSQPSSSTSRLNVKEVLHERDLRLAADRERASDRSEPPTSLTIQTEDDHHRRHSDRPLTYLDKDSLVDGLAGVFAQKRAQRRSSLPSASSRPGSVTSSLSGDPDGTIPCTSPFAGTFGIVSGLNPEAPRVRVKKATRPKSSGIPTIPSRSQWSTGFMPTVPRTRVQF